MSFFEHDVLSIILLPEALAADKVLQFAHGLIRANENCSTAGFSGLSTYVRDCNDKCCVLYSIRLYTSLTILVQSEPGMRSRLCATVSMIQYVFLHLFQGMTCVVDVAKPMKHLCLYAGAKIWVGPLCGTSRQRPLRRAALGRLLPIARVGAILLRQSLIPISRCHFSGVL